MKKIIEEYYCDVCKEKTDISEKDIQVIFLTEQTEGRTVKPYLCNQKIEICDKCMEKLLSGKYIFAQGCQGYNMYHFKKD